MQFEVGQPRYRSDPTVQNWASGCMCHQAKASVEYMLCMQTTQNSNLDIATLCLFKGKVSPEALRLYRSEQVMLVLAAQFPDCLKDFQMCMP